MVVIINLIKKIEYVDYKYKNILNKMRREYMQSLPKSLQIKNEAYNTYITNIQQLFIKIK